MNLAGRIHLKKSNEFRKLRTRDLAEGRRHAAPNPTHWPASLKRARSPPDHLPIDLAPGVPGFRINTAPHVPIDPTF